MNRKNYDASYNDRSFWETILEYAQAIGKGLLEEALMLYYALNDSSVPIAAKGIIIGALGYLICPIDVIPDVIPILGFTDDASVIIAARTFLEAYLKEEHSERAQAKVKELFE